MEHKALETWQISGRRSILEAIHCKTSNLEGCKARSQAAYFMGLAVSGSLALVMCPLLSPLVLQPFLRGKEPLRLALTSGASTTFEAEP